jgi:hypothetical protein
LRVFPLFPRLSVNLRSRPFRSPCCGGLGVRGPTEPCSTYPAPHRASFGGATPGVVLTGAQDISRDRFAGRGRKDTWTVVISIAT